MHFMLSPLADGDLCGTTALHLGDALLSQTQASSCCLTFPLIYCSTQSNTVINKDHKPVTAFITLKFMAKKRGCRGQQRWLLFGESFPHSMSKR